MLPTSKQSVNKEVINDLWSQPRLRRLCFLLGWCVPALIALTVFGVGLATAMPLRGVHRMPGGITGTILLVAATAVVAGPSVVDARRLEGRLRRLGLPGDEQPADDEVELSDDSQSDPVGSLAGPR
jgi:hypothetical protein